MNEFINSRSMLTPGLAGALVMFLANALIGAFGLDGYRALFVLGMSFLMGIIVFGDDKVKPYLKVVLYVINSLIIFAVANGSNTIGKRATEASQPEVKSIIEPIGEMRSSKKSIFVFTQIVRSDSSQVKANILANQLKSASNSILLLQGDIVTNQKTYNDPQTKINSLQEINKKLVVIKTLVDKDTTLSNTKYTKYQSDIAEVIGNVNTMQGKLLHEKKTTRQGFFKDWN